MRCDCCDVLLTPQESVRRFRDSGAFTNTCTRCLRDIPVDTVEGSAFREEEDVDYKDHALPFDNDDLDEI
jgi:hypothetical protein